jgi:hypothetical protein
MPCMRCLPFMHHLTVRYKPASSGQAILVTDLQPYSHQHHPWPCMQNYDESRITNFYNDTRRLDAPGQTALVCTPKNLSASSAWSPAVISIVTIGGFMVLAAAVVLIINACRPRGYRSAGKRAWDHVKWRLQGMPKSGTISVVVTDIEGYSGGCHGAHGLPTRTQARSALPLL